MSHWIYYQILTFVGTKLQILMHSGIWLTSLALCAVAIFTCGEAQTTIVFGRIPQLNHWTRKDSVRVSRCQHNLHTPSTSPASHCVRIAPQSAEIELLRRSGSSEEHILREVPYSEHGEGRAKASRPRSALAHSRWPHSGQRLACRVRAFRPCRSDGSFTH